jgi:hypothetical protein
MTRGGIKGLCFDDDEFAVLNDGVVLSGRMWPISMV